MLELCELFQKVVVANNAYQCELCPLLIWCIEYDFFYHDVVYYMILVESLMSLNVLVQFEDECFFKWGRMQQPL